MSGWNRLFVVVAVCWVSVAPFGLMHEVNRSVFEASGDCGRTAYRNYGASDSRVRLDLDRHDAEVKLCSARFARDFVSPPMLAGAMVGLGDGTLGLIGWGVILIPLALLWVGCWGALKVFARRARGTKRDPEDA
jgi:hypothetical protein